MLIIYLNVVNYEMLESLPRKMKKIKQSFAYFDVDVDLKN